MKNHSIDFEDFLCVENSEIDKKAYELLQALTGMKNLEWQMEMIGPLVDRAKSILDEQGISYCHPYYEEGEKSCIPCYKGEDCNNKSCVLKRKIGKK